MYRIHAANCIRLAQKAADSEGKLALLDMARAWRTLADQAEKNSETTLVYETPEPQRHVAQKQHVAQQQQQPQPDDSAKDE